MNSAATECRHVLTLNASERCAFVQENADCLDVGGFVEYTQLYFCHFVNHEWAAVALMLGWLVFLFAALATAAEDFFCPNLAAISRSLSLSDNIAGVTLLAFGNGAPDIFSSMAGVSQKRPELVMGELFGATLFLSTGVTGMVCLVGPFKIMERPFLRDIVFLLAAGYWAFYIFYREEVFLYDAVGFLALYVVYILVVLIGRYINQKLRASRRAAALLNNVESDSTDDEIENEPLNIFVPAPRLSPARPRTDEDEENEANEAAEENEESIRTAPHLVEEQTLDNLTPPAYEEPSVSEPWSLCFSRLNPLRSFKERSRVSKILALVRAPAMLALTLTVPVVDAERSPANGWCRRLHATQLLLAPAFVVSATGNARTDLTPWGVDLWQISVAAGLVLSLAFLCIAPEINFRQRTLLDRPPCFQPMMAYVGFAIAVCWIYLAANEVVSLLKTLGVISGVSDAALGLTLLAWGNSAGDLAADVAVGRKGMPRMGFSACLGGPLFNLLLGVGLSFTLALLGNNVQWLVVKRNVTVMALCAAVAVALVTLLLVIPLSGFRATRAHGVFLLGVYSVLLASVLTVEFLPNYV